MGEVYRALHHHQFRNLAELGGEVLLLAGADAFSKKIENHAAAVALYFMYYNFVRIHKTLRISPAMAAGVTDRLWEIGDIVALLEN